MTLCDFHRRMAPVRVPSPPERLPAVPTLTEVLDTSNDQPLNLSLKQSPHQLPTVAAIESAVNLTTQQTTDVKTF